MIKQTLTDFENLVSASHMGAGLSPSLSASGPVPC